MGLASIEHYKWPQARTDRFHGARWSRHCVVHSVEHGVNSTIAFNDWKRAIFAPLDNLNGGAIATEMQVTPFAVGLMRGIDLAGGSLCVVRHQLRYCVKCLDLGYHSVVFQHVALARCPLHDLPLEDVCRYCGKAIMPTFLSAITHPFECPHCNTSLARTVPRCDDSHDATLADKMVGARRDMLRGSPNTRQWDIQLSGMEVQLGSPSYPKVSRHYQRMCIWAEPSDPHWLCYREETMNIAAVENFTATGSAYQLNISLAAERVIFWLRKVCFAHEPVAIELAHRLGRFPRPDRSRRRHVLLDVVAKQLAMTTPFDVRQRVEVTPFGQ